MEIKEVVEIFSLNLSNLERVGEKINFSDEKIKCIGELVMKNSSISREKYLKQFYKCSGVEKYAIENIYLTLNKIENETFLEISKEKKQQNPYADLYGLYWVIFSKEKYLGNPIIYNLCKNLENKLWDKKEKTILETIDCLKKLTAV